MPSVRVRGQGVAASCCAHLLNTAGVPVVIESTGRPQLPAILLGETTQQLIADVFGGTGQFDKLPQIDRRIVRWGADAAPVTLPHRAAVISEETLSSLLRPALPPADGAMSEWSIYAARPLPAECVEHSFGTRTATAMPVT